MQLKIKGGKDRYVPISQRFLEELRAYWKIDRPANYLFPGKTPDATRKELVQNHPSRSWLTTRILADSSGIATSKASAT